MSPTLFRMLLATALILCVHSPLFAEWEEAPPEKDARPPLEESQSESFREEMESDTSAPNSRSKRRKKSYRRYKEYKKSRRTNRPQRQRQQRRYREDDRDRTKYFVEDTERVDAGQFHVGFAAGGNFYIEPKFDANGIALGEYFKDFGFQGGVYFDFDYDDLRLQLRGFIGYKYILESVHVFTFEGAARYLFTFSENAKFGLGIGPGGSLWFRSNTAQTQGEEVLFLPFFIISAGFDFNPFMVDFKFPVHRIGENTTILGMELYFGVRL